MKVFLASPRQPFNVALDVGMKSHPRPHWLLPAMSGPLVGASFASSGLSQLATSRADAAHTAQLTAGHPGVPSKTRLRTQSVPSRHPAPGSCPESGPREWQPANLLTSSLSQAS